MAQDWSRNAEQVKAFHVAAYTALVKKGALQPHSTSGMKPWQNDEYMNIYNKWRDTIADDQKGLALSDYLSLFIRDAVRDYAPADRHSVVMTLTCKVVRDYGTMQVEYGLSGEYLIYEEGQLPGAYAHLRELIEAQHQRAAENQPALMPNATKDHAGITTEVIQAVEVRKEFVDNAERIRIAGGDYQKHGIAVYPEFFEALRINPADLPFGATPYTHLVRIQLDQKGNPKRALEIVSQP